MARGYEFVRAGMARRVGTVEELGGGGAVAAVVDEGALEAHGLARGLKLAKAVTVLKMVSALGKL